MTPSCLRRLWAAPALLCLLACPDSSTRGGERVDPNVALIEQSLVLFRDAQAPEAAAKSAPVRRAEAAVLAGAYGEAERELRSLLGEQPGDPYARFLLGISIHEQKLYSAARGHFEELLREGPRFPRAFNVYYYYGWCLLKLGEIAGAKRAFEAHLEFSPDTGDSHLALGMIALEEGHLDESQKHMERALELSRRPDDRAAVHAAMGDLSMERGDLERARESFQAAIELFPGQAEVYYKLAGIERRLGNEDAAEARMLEHERWSATSKGLAPAQPSEN